MQVDQALRLLSELLWNGFVICGPLLAVTMAVGLLVSIAQVITQIQEMSLTFVPKLVAAGVVLLVVGGWMLKRIAQYAIQLWTAIPSLF